VSNPVKQPSREESTKKKKENTLAGSSGEERGTSTSKKKKKRVRWEATNQVQRRKTENDLRGEKKKGLGKRFEHANSGKDFGKVGKKI